MASSILARNRECLLIQPRHASNQADCGSIGYDLTATEPKMIPARRRVLVDIWISIQLPRGTYGRIAPRSWAGFCVGAGVISPDYCGQLAVVLFNHSERDFHLHQEARIAQLILERALIVAVKNEMDPQPIPRRLRRIYSDVQTIYLIHKDMTFLALLHRTVSQISTLKSLRFH